MNNLILSLFPGIGLLDKAFEEEGFCVVRGPDLLWGGDIRRFYPPSGMWAGCIGGPPCQDFSPLAGINRKLGRQPRFGNLIPEFERVVGEAQPGCWLMENVERAPIPVVDGYETTSFVLDNRWFGEQQHRRRRFTFGARRRVELAIDGLVALEDPIYEPAVVSTTGYLLKNGSQYLKSRSAVECITASRKRPISRLAELQGLPPDFLDDAPFTIEGKRKVIANGIPLPMGRAVAAAVRRVMAVEG